MATISGPPLAAYLIRLDRATRHLPRDSRLEVMRDVRVRIDAALAGTPSTSPGQVSAVLRSLGSPEALVAAALAGTEPARTRLAGRDILTVLLLLFGGLVVPVVGWAAGVFLLWTSTAWRTRDKVIGTLVVPGGLGSLLLEGVRHSSAIVAIAIVGSTLTAWWLARCAYRTPNLRTRVPR